MHTQQRGTRSREAHAAERHVQKRGTCRREAHAEERHMQKRGTRSREAHPAKRHVQEQNLPVEPFLICTLLPPPPHKVCALRESHG
ncbi:hypothetical protein POVWA2_057080 [Plasmodium ovale wallikeri]|uniref:Uncharacterized protein n=1 Tax=Plasmodium ovale wallikeri TaxID=864142 RepID=A0A1A8ZYG6_PLAOA|nr:hypothetical protein POVWA1_057730 [Plasmodium ovale wallikeri]SBT48935.1 hypothetical protein POVWA2_057080 [Plasmodium ovale wallikeri]